MTAAATPEHLVAQLTALLRVEPLGDDTFEGARTPAGAENGAGRIFGGQVIAQAFAAAAATVAADRLPHSLHAYFLRMGDDAQPVRYEVSRDLDGGSFSNRRIVAHQGDRLLLTMMASYHRLEDGLHHQDEMPDVPGPENLPTETDRRQGKLDHLPEKRRAAVNAPRPIEQRSVEDFDLFSAEAGPPHLHTWFRATAPVGDDPLLHRAMLAYASDYALLPTATRRHGLNWFGGEVQTASLDHALWFHDEFRIDDWLLYETQSAWTGRGRGLISGKIFSRDGRLVASVRQEGMIRVVKRG